MVQTHIFSLATRLTGLSCPRCESTVFHRHGQHLGIQRFRCQECGRTFKETVNTPLHWIHNKPKMQNYLTTMYDRKSLRTAASEIGISEVTSFNWRHKILSSLNLHKTGNDGAPSGICEIIIPHSFKGQRVILEEKMPVTRSIMVTDARGIPSLHLLTKKNKITEISDQLTDSLSSTVEIASAKTNLLTRAEKRVDRKKIMHKTCKKNIMAQAKAQVNELGLWMERFNGVATKYLQQYWNWYRAETNLGTFEKFHLECFGQRQLPHFRLLQSC